MPEGRWNTSASWHARATQDPHCLALAYTQVAMMDLLGGNFPAMLEASRACLQAAEACGDQVYVYLGQGFRAWAESRLGDQATAQASLVSLRAVGRSLGGRLSYSDWFAAMEAEIALNAGRVAEACALAEQAVTHARAVGGIFAEGLAQRVWGQALARTRDQGAGTRDQG